MAITSCLIIKEIKRGLYLVPGTNTVQSRHESVIGFLMHDPVQSLHVASTSFPTYFVLDIKYRQDRAGSFPQSMRASPLQALVRVLDWGFSRPDNFLSRPDSVSFSK